MGGHYVSPVFMLKGRGAEGGAGEKKATTTIKQSKQQRCMRSAKVLLLLLNHMWVGVDGQKEGF
jgi:hypothetical protein